MDRGTLGGRVSYRSRGIELSEEVCITCVKCATFSMRSVRNTNRETVCTAGVITFQNESIVSCKPYVREQTAKILLQCIHGDFSSHAQPQACMPMASNVRVYGR